MKRFFFLLIICVSFYACKPGIPKDIIQPDKMEKVLLDIHIVDGYISVLPGVDTAKKVGSAFYKGIYKKFNIDSALYNKSINYYYQNPNLMKKMYDSITVRLAKLKELNGVVVNDSKITSHNKGIFDKDAIDSTLLDFNLNLKYNYRILKNNVFTNITNPAVLTLKKDVIVQPSLTEPIKQQLEVPAAVVEPAQLKLKQK